MSIRTTIDAPDIRPDTIGPEHLKSDPDSLGKITGNVLRLFGDRIVIGTGKSLTHGSTVIVGSDAKIPWSVLKNHVSITAGEGLAGGGSLSGNVTLSVDSTVVRTTGDFTLSGVLTLNNNLIVSDGRVGIGTVSPQHELHIESAAPVLRLHSSASNNPEGAKIRLTEDQWQGAYIHYEADANRLDIGVHETVDSLPENDIPVISILRSNRRVGIGTTSPSYPLHVSGDFGFTGTLQQGTVPWARLSGHPSIIAGTGLSGGGPLSSSQTLSVVYGSTAGTAVEGNKQITITPGTNLSGGGTITLGAGGSVTVSVVDNPAFPVSVTTPLVTNTGTLTLKGDGTSGTIVFITNDAERMRITSQGYVGIGTTAPSYALHVTGDVGFTGTLQQGTVPWARLSGHPSITAGTGLLGGGSLSASRTLSVNFGSDAGTVAEGNKTITVTAGSGLAGGGTVTIGAGGSVTLTNADPGSAQNIFKRIANSSGTVQFAAASNDDVLQFAAGTGLSVAFDAENKRITYSHALKAGTGIQVSGDTITNTGIISLSAGSGISVSGTNPATITNTDRGSAQNIFKNIANASGTTQFSAGSNSDTLRFAAGGILSVAFDADNKQITYSASLTAGTNISINGSQIATVANPTFSTSVTTPSLISTSNLSLTAQGANNILFTTNNTERMRIASSGNVGIGTASPAYKLDVAGDVRFTGTLQGGTVPWARLSGVPAASISAAGIVQLNDSVTSTSTTQAATANAVKTAYDTAVAANNNANNRVAKSGDTMTGNLMFSGGTRYIGTSDSNSFILRTANADRVTIISNGNVGIGTTNPAYKLDVAGDVRFTGTLQGGTVPWERLSGVPSASTSSAGIVQLTDSVSSDSVTTAATPRSVKQAIERARESPIAIKEGHLFHFDHGLQSTRGLRPLLGAVATLRPGEGRFGGAVAVEEGTTNLLPASKAEAEANPDVTANAIWSIDTTRMRTGSGSLRVEWNGSGSYSQAEYRLNVTPGQTYTFSAYAYVESSGYKGEIVLQEASTPYRAVGSGLIDLVPGKWNRLSVTWTLPSDINLPLRCQVRAPRNASGQYVTGVPIWWDSLQLEQKPFATSFVAGTRADGRLAYDNLIPARTGTIAFWFALDSDWMSVPGSATLLGCGFYDSVRNQLYIDKAGGLRFVIYDSAGLYKTWTCTPPNFGAGEWHHLAVVYDNGNAIIYIDGAPQSLSVGGGGTGILSIDLPLNLGYNHYDLLRHINALFDELLILPYAASEEEIKAWYESKAPFYDPEEIIDVSQGGTGHKSLPEGQILFGSGAEPIGSDPGLYWNNSNKRLGIGTSAPAYPLDVVGDVRFTGTLQGGTIRAGRGAVVINEDGLRSYKDGQVTFEINTSGDTWFWGDVRARTFILPVRPA